MEGGRRPSVQQAYEFTFVCRPPWGETPRAAGISTTTALRNSRVSLIFVFSSIWVGTTTLYFIIHELSSHESFFASLSIRSASY